MNYQTKLLYQVQLFHFGNHTNKRLPWDSFSPKSFIKKELNRIAKALYSNALTPKQNK